MPRASRRAATHAGSWYDQREAVLTQLLERWLSAVPADATLLSASGCAGCVSLLGVSWMQDMDAWCSMTCMSMQATSLHPGPLAPQVHATLCTVTGCQL